MISIERLSSFKAILEQEVEFEATVTEELLEVSEFLGPLLLARIFLTQREMVDHHALDDSDERGGSFLSVLAGLLTGYDDEEDFERYLDDD